MISIPITLRDHDVAGLFGQPVGAARQQWPVRFGVPFPRGRLREDGELTLRDGTQSVPVQTQVTNRWPDGSVRWVSALALVDLAVSETRTLQLTTGPRPAAPAVVAVQWDAGTLRYREQTLASSPPEFELELANGQTYRPVWEPARMEVEGALRKRLVFAGRYVSTEGQPLFDVEFGWELTAGQTWIEGFHRLTHRVSGEPQLAVRRLTMRQRWDLPDGQYLVRQLNRGEEWLPRDVRRPGAVAVRVTAQRVLVADHAMVGEVPASYPPYLRKGLDGIEPWLAWENAQATVMFWTPEPVGHSPQNWRLDDGEFDIEWIPASSDPAVFSQGRAKTHRWRWQFAPGQLTAPAELARQHTQPPLVSVDPAWVRSCGVCGLGQALAYEPRRYARFEGILDGLFEIKWPVGMMNWGDDVDDNYTTQYAASGVKSDDAVWTNNEYDFLYATFHQMLRTGHGRLWRLIERSAQHALDIDFVHFSDDPWLQHGSPAHSARHTTASSYPSHIWTEGLLHYYYWSGDERALAVAKLSGEFLLRFAEKRGWVLELTAREAGWAVLAFTELFVATADDKYRHAARRVVGRILELTERNEPVFATDASFFVAVLVMGLDKLHTHDPDERIPQAIDRIMQWRLDHRLSPEGWPLYHWNAAARMINSREIMFPAALAIAYRHTRQPAYRETLWRCLQVWLDRQTFHSAPRCTKTAAAFYRTWAEALAVLAEDNHLERLEYQPW